MAVSTSVAGSVAVTLRGLGVRRVYGLPGEDHMRVLAEFAAAGLEYCSAYNESAAAVMAATDGQLTGLPGVVVLSLAPGVSNGLNGVLHAHLEQLPLLVVSGQHADPRLPLVVRQGFDIAGLLAPVTKWQARITAGADVAAVLGKAVDEAMSGRPGPVYLELSDGAANAEAPGGVERANAVAAHLRSRWAEPGRADVRQPAPGPVRQLAERIAAAQRPVLVVGGRRRRVTTATVGALAERARMPVFTSSRQKGTLDGRSPYFAGTFLNGNLETGLLGRADLLLIVDPDPFDFYNRPWSFPAATVALTEDLFSEWLNPLTERIATDAEAMLAAVLAELGETRSSWTPADVADYRSGLREQLLAPDMGGMSVAAAVAAALDVWPADGWLVADAGFGKPVVALLSEPAVPDRYLASHALSTMGYAVPAAIAAGRAGAEPVLAFLGDGSLLMRAGELAVSPETGMHTVFVALMDRSMTQIEVKQERLGLAPVGVALPPLSCARLGPALGIGGIDAATPDDVRTAVAKGLQGGGPLLVGAMVDPRPSRPLFELLRG